MDNRFYKTICNVLQTNSENTPDGPRWYIPGHIITATLNSDEVELFILFPDDTEISIKCQTPMQTATVCNMLRQDHIKNVTGTRMYSTATINVPPVIPPLTNA